VTKIDLDVLKFLSKVPYATPAEIGQAAGGTVSGKAQGLGRLGANRASRLFRMGLIEDCSAIRGGFATWRISAMGLAKVREMAVT
jgi:hypothetical protein